MKDILAQHEKAVRLVMKRFFTVNKEIEKYTYNSISLLKKEYINGIIDYMFNVCSGSQFVRGETISYEDYDDVYYFEYFATESENYSRAQGYTYCFKIPIELTGTDEVFNEFLNKLIIEIKENHKKYLAQKELEEKEKNNEEYNLYLKLKEKFSKMEKDK